MRNSITAKILSFCLATLFLCSCGGGSSQSETKFYIKSEDLSLSDDELQVTDVARLLRTPEIKMSADGSGTVSLTLPHGDWIPDFLSFLLNSDIKEKVELLETAEADIGDLAFSNRTILQGAEAIAITTRVREDTAEFSVKLRFKSLSYAADGEPGPTKKAARVLTRSGGSRAPVCLAISGLSADTASGICGTNATVAEYSQIVTRESGSVETSIEISAAINSTLPTLQQADVSGMPFPGATMSLTRYTPQANVITYAEYLFTSPTVHNLKRGTSIDGTVPSLDLVTFTLDSSVLQLRYFQRDQVGNLLGQTTVNVSP